MQLPRAWRSSFNAFDSRFLVPYIRPTFFNFLFLMFLFFLIPSASPPFCYPQVPTMYTPHVLRLDSSSMFLGRER